MLFLSNYLGPDVFWVLGIGRYAHALLFWPLFALILTLPYRYFTRFTIKIDGIKNIEIIDLERYKLHYLNTYFLVLAGGIMHNYLDGIMKIEGEFRIIPQLPLNYKELSLTMKDLVVFGKEGIIQVNFLILMFTGVALIFGFIFVFVWFLKKNSIKTAVITILYIVIFEIFFYLVGSMATMFHPDGGAIIYVSIFWGSPLILCVLSTRDFKFIKKNENSVVKKKTSSVVKQNKIILFIVLWLSIIGVLNLIASILGFIYNEALLSYIFSKYGDDISEYYSYNQFLMLFITGEVILFIISLLNFICVIGLLLKNRKIWKFAIIYQLIFSWTIIGLIIACALNHNSVKEKFRKK